MAKYIELSELEKAVIVKQTQEEKYWFDWLKQFRATTEYSVKEQAVDNFLRGYHEAVQFMLSTNEELLLKSADVVEVRHGEWIEDCDRIVHCSVCKVARNNFHGVGGSLWHYCPNCGAEMNGKGVDNG